MEPDPKTDLDRVAELWDQTARERAVNPIQGWLDSPLVLETYVQPKISGSPHVNWLIGVVDRLRIPKGGQWLSLGCGAAGLEIFASGQGLFASLVALDASPGSITEARKAADAQGVTNIRFETGANLNDLTLPKGDYDVILMNMSLHHVKKIRPLLGQIHDALKPSGFFVVNEFIGPRQFQFTDLQLALVRDLLGALPASWRTDSTTGEIKSEYHRMPVEHWNVADPSEAIRSDIIVDEIERRFRIVERIDYGGTILNLLLEHIVHNFDPGNEKDTAGIRLLAGIEDLLIRHKVIPSDFSVIVSRRGRS